MQVELDLIANLDQAQVGIKNLNTSTASLQKTATNAGNSMQTTFAKAGNDAKSFATQINAGANSLAGLRQRLEELRAQREVVPIDQVTALNAEIHKAEGQVQVLTGRFTEAGQRIRKGFGATIEQVTSLGAGVVGVTNLIGLLGDKGEKENEALAKATKALVLIESARAVVQGVVEAKELALSIIGQARASQLAVQTAGTLALATAEEGEAVATEAATVATKGFTASLLANPAVLFASAIAALVGAFFLFSKGAKEGIGVLEQFKLGAEEFANKVDSIRKSFENLKKEQDADLELTKANNDEYLALLRKRGATEEEITKKRIDFNKSNADQQAAIIQTEIDGLNKIQKANEDRLKSIKKDTSIRVIDPNDVVKDTQLMGYEVKVTEAFQTDIGNIKRDSRTKQQREADDAAQKELLKLQQDNTDIVSAKKVLATSLEVLQKKTSATTIDEQTKADEELKKKREEFNKAILDLKKRADAAELSGGTARERIEAEKIAAEDELAIFRKTLEEKAKLAGVHLSSGQSDQLNIIQEGINRKFNKEMEALELEHQITLLGIQFKSSDAQVALLKAEQDKKRQSLLEAGATEQQIAEENAREINALTEKISLAKIDAENKISKDIINERQKGKQREIEFEKQKEIDLLNADLLAESKRLNVLISHITADDDIVLEQQIEDSKANIKKLGDAINKATGELRIEERKFSWVKLLGLEVKPEDEARVEAALSQAVAQIGTAINSITASIFQEQQDAVQVQIDNNQKLVDSLNQRISDEEQALNQELALQKQGYASNVDGKRKEIASLIAERNKDMANQQSLHEQKKKLAKEQAAIELVEQEAAIVTAGAQVIKGFAGIPVVGLILGLAAAASLVAGFLAFKAKVRAAETLGEGGEVDGELHSNGGNKYVSMDGRSRIKEIERGEFIVKKKSTQKHRALIEAINKDNFDKLEFVDLIPLLKGTGVVLKDGVEKGISSEAVSLHKFQVNQISNMRLENVEKSLSEIHETIADIGNKILGKEERTNSSNGETIKKNGNTTIIRK